MPQRDKAGSPMDIKIYIYGIYIYIHILVSMLCMCVCVLFLYYTHYTPYLCILVIYYYVSVFLEWPVGVLEGKLFGDMKVVANNTMPLERIP